jgi:uncharacterized protein YaaR (DUF327 family)
MAKLLVTEGRSTKHLSGFKNLVRVFIDGDYSYGYWFEEKELYNILDEEQKNQYFQVDPIVCNFTISEKVAETIKNLGISPFKKAPRTS